MREDAKPFRGDRVKEFFEGSGPAWKRHDRVCCLEHEPLSCLHVVDQGQLGQALMRPFQLAHETRNNPNDFAALSQSAIRDGPHGAFCAAAINEGVPGSRDLAPQLLRGLVKMRFAARARSAKDEDATILGHRAPHSRETFRGVDAFWHRP